MRINNNMMAMNTHRQLGVANGAGAKSMEKLSSGMRINRAGDDAAGLAISEKMRGQIRGLNQASSNAQDGISLIQTAEGALNETHAILQRMRELSVQSSTDTNTDADRLNIQDEIDQLAGEITRIAETTQFNTMNLLDGTFEGKKFHIGANEGQDVTIAVNAMDSKALEVAGKVDGLYNGAENATGVTLGTDGTDGVGQTGGPNTKGIGANFTDGKYSVVKKADYKGTAVTDAKLVQGTIGDVSHYLVNSNGEAVGTSTNGTDFHALGDIAFVDAGGTSGTEATAGTRATLTLTSGAVGVEISGTKTTQAFEAKFATGQSLSGGTYTVAGGDTAGTFELLNSKGEVMAESTDGKAWTVDGNAFMTTEALAIGDKLEVKVAGIDVSTQDKASVAITTINTALENVSKERSKLGAVQNRLEHTIKNLDTSAENLQASEARIRDVDMAKEMMEQTKQNILAQASTAMLANANQSPQSVLQLLG